MSSKISLKPADVGRYKSFIVTAVQTVITIALAFIMTLIGCKFRIEEFDWIMFVMSFALSTYMKAVYTEYQKGKELAREGITLLENTINEDKKDIYAEEKTKEFDDEVDRINNINKLDSYISLLDNIPEVKKTDEIKELRKWAFNYEKTLEREENVDSFEEIKSISSIKWVKYDNFFWHWRRVKYEKISSSKLFAFGRNGKKRAKKYSFSAFAASFNRLVVPLTVTTIFSLIFGFLAPDPNNFTWELLMQLISYLFSISLGIWWGVRNGKAIIQEDYTEVLNNVASFVREVKTKVLSKPKKTEVKENVSEA